LSNLCDHGNDAIWCGPGTPVAEASALVENAPNGPDIQYHGE